MVRTGASGLKPARGERTRQGLIAEASRLFAIHGYFHTSTSDLLEAVSLSKGAFYHHFRSKEELAEAVLGQLREDYQRMVTEPAGLVAEPGERLEAVFARVVELNESGQWNNCLLLARLIQEMAEQEGPLCELIVETLDWLISFWEGLVADAQAAGAVKAELDPRSTAEMIVSALLGAISFRELDDQVVHFGKVAAHIESLLMADR